MYSEEYNVVGAAKRLIGDELTLDLDIAGINGGDEVYCNVNQCRLATENDISGASTVYTD